LQIFGSGPLGIRGIKEIHDVDILVTISLYELKTRRGGRRSFVMATSTSITAMALNFGSIGSLARGTPKSLSEMPK
jgi:hypothetical protein